MRPRVPSLLLSIFVLASALRAEVKISDYPLRIQILFFHYTTFYQNRTEERTKGDSGRANLFENGDPSGMDFEFDCLKKLKTSSGFETFPAKWKKPSQQLTVLVPNFGKTESHSTCELKVEMKNFAYYVNSNGKIATEPTAFYKQWMTQNEYDPEHGKDVPTWGVYRIGGDVSPPVVTVSSAPEYSEEARKGKYQGTVLLSIVVDPSGIPRDIHVVRPFGSGLDEKAIEAVARWRFRPGMKDGRPVATLAQVEVNFRLLEGGEPAKLAATGKQTSNEPTVGSDPAATLALAKELLNAKRFSEAFQESAKSGNAEAQLYVGAAYQNGMAGVTQDYAQARQWYEKAAAGGNAAATNALGVLFYFGRGVALDYTQARSLFEKAAAAGNGAAMDNLGNLYRNGYGVEQDYTQARQWYEKGAAAGNAPAIGQLGNLYEHGLGVVQDYGQARQWY